MGRGNPEQKIEKMEKVKQSSGDRAALKWLIAGAKGKKRYVFLLLAVQVIAGVLSMGYALFFSGLVDCAIGKDSSGFVRYAVSLALLVVVQFVLRYISHYLTEFCFATLENTFKHRLFRSLLKKDYSSVTATHSGEWLNRMTSDTRVVADGITNILPNATATVVRMAAALILLVMLTPAFGIGFVVGGAGIVALTWGFRKILKRLHREVQAADGKLRVFLSERLGSLMILRAFGQQKAAMEQAGEDFRMLILPDHPNPIRYRTHTGDPVPYVLYDSTLQRKAVAHYNEKEAAAAGNFEPCGHKLMARLLQK